MAALRKQLKKKLTEEKDKNVYDFGEGENEKKELSESEDEVRGGKSSRHWLSSLALASPWAN